MVAGGNGGPGQVISICGLSCVGKGTLIDTLHFNFDGARERFGIAEQPEFFASRSTTRSGNVRYRQTEEMFRLPSPRVIVFRWQFKQDHMIDDLLACFPNARHSAIVLWRPWADQARDAFEIHNGQITAEDQMQRWFKTIHRRFGPESDLPARGVKITLVDASQPDYPEMSWPSH